MYLQGFSTITHCLEMTPLPLHDGLWRIFRKYKLCLNPDEEIKRRFCNADPVKLESGSFGEHIMRALRSLCTLSPEFSDKKIIPVQGQKLGISIGYNDEEFKIHDSLFTFEGAHQTAFCEDTAKTPDAHHQVFTCDHIVLLLWDHMIDIIQSQGSIELSPGQTSMLRSMARSKLQQMPRGILVGTDPYTRLLHVSWTSMEPLKNIDKDLRITLHTENCEAVTSWADELVHNVSYEEMCSCLSKNCSLGSGYVIFSLGLPTTARYFPMVSRAENNAFYGSIAGSVSIDDVSIFSPQKEGKAAEIPSINDISKVCSNPPPSPWGMHTSIIIETTMTDNGI